MIVIYGRRWRFAERGKLIVCDSLSIDHFSDNSSSVKWIRSARPLARLLGMQLRSIDGVLDLLIIDERVDVVQVF